jgi:hypothetical protein
MKTKTSTLRFAVIAFACLLFSGSAISQKAVTEQNGLIRRLAHEKTLHKTPGHFAASPGQSIGERSFSGNNQREVVYLADTVIRYSLTGGSERVANAYNSAGKLLSTLEQIWMINKWVNTRITTNTYDANNGLLTRLIQLWQNTDWINEQMITCTNDASGNCLTKTGQGWDGSGWVNQGQSNYTYDGNGNMLTELFREWDGLEWMNSSNDSCTYNENGNCLTHLNQFWDGLEWMYNSMQTCAYDANGKIITDLYQSFDGEGWQNDMMSSYTNNANGNRLTSIDQFWDSGEWLAFYKDSMFYDESENYIGYTNYNCWDGETWEPYSHGIATHDASGNVLNFMHQQWRGEGIWENSDNVEYTYQDGVITADCYIWSGTIWTPGDTYLSVRYNDNGNMIQFFSGGPAVQVVVYYSTATVGIDKLPESENSLFTVFPNPVKDRLTVISQSPAAIIENVRITGLTGNVLPVQFTGNSLDMGELPQGIYFLSLTTRDGQISVKKIIKQ